MWLQHAIHYPECVFVLLYYKGTQFIANVKNEFNNINRNNRYNNSQVRICKLESYDVVIRRIIH